MTADLLTPCDRGGVVGRYAPSPTGPQHLGNLRTALAAWLQARVNNGVFIVRMEDLDTPRVKAGSAADILADLAWLGLDYDEGPDRPGPAGSCTQSERVAIYDAAFAQLQKSGAAFACYCSRRDIREAASAPHGSDGPIYPGTCRTIDAPSSQRTPSWRLRVDDAVVAFDDQIAGTQHVNLATDSGDFVIRRADGTFAYQLAVAVDDALMGVTDVVRGDDLLSSTSRQIHVLERLGLPVPRYWHVPVMRDATGERLSKRDGSESLQSLRDKGWNAEQVIGELALGLGLLDTAEALGAAALVDRLTPQMLSERMRRVVSSPG